MRCASEKMGRLAEEPEDYRPTKCLSPKTEEEMEIAPSKGPYTHNNADETPASGDTVRTWTFSFYLELA